MRSVREELKASKAAYDKTEDDLKALQSVGQIIGEVLRQLDEERCEYFFRFFLLCKYICFKIFIRFLRATPFRLPQSSSRQAAGLAML